MTIDGTPLDNLSFEDVQSLVDTEVEEGQRLEFKRDLDPPKWTSGYKRNLLKSVAALANGGGGRLIFGLGEKDSVAAKVVGVPNAGDRLDSLLQVCRDNIQPRISRLRAVTIPLTSGPRAVIVVDVPDSFDRPHMITYKGGDKTDFWTRHVRNRQRMTMPEIETAFELRGRRQQDLLDRFDDARASVGRFVSKAPDHDRWMWVAFAPAGEGRDLVSQDPRAVSINLGSAGTPDVSFSTAESFPTLRGTFIGDSPATDQDEWFTAVEVWTDGTFTSAFRLNPSPDGLAIYARHLAAIAATATAGAAAIYEAFEVAGPVAVQLGVPTSHGIHLVGSSGQGSLGVESSSPRSSSQR